MIDYMNQEYKALDEDTKAQIQAVKSLANELFLMIDMLADDQIRADLDCCKIAASKVIEASMWAVRGLSNKRA